MSTIQVRTDDNIKNQARKILETLGLYLSSAINMYLHQIVIRGGIPFVPRTENGFTRKQEAMMLRETAEALKHGKVYDSVDELFDEILSEDDGEAEQADT